MKYSIERSNVENIETCAMWSYIDGAIHFTWHPLSKLCRTQAPKAATNTVIIMRNVPDPFEGYDVDGDMEDQRGPMTLTECKNLYPSYIALRYNRATQTCTLLKMAVGIPFPAKMGWTSRTTSSNPSYTNVPQPYRTTPWSLKLGFLNATSMYTGRTSYLQVTDKSMYYAGDTYTEVGTVAGCADLTNKVQRIGFTYNPTKRECIVGLAPMIGFKLYLPGSSTGLPVAAAGTFVTSVHTYNTGPACLAGCLIYPGCSHVQWFQNEHSCLLYTLFDRPGSTSGWLGPESIPNPYMSQLKSVNIRPSIVPTMCMCYDSTRRLVILGDYCQSATCLWSFITGGQITNDDSDLCLDSRSTSGDQYVDVQPCNVIRASQLWSYKGKILSTVDGMVTDLPLGYAVLGAAVLTHPLQATSSQTWDVNSGVKYATVTLYRSNPLNNDTIQVGTGLSTVSLHDLHTSSDRPLYLYGSIPVQSTDKRNFLNIAVKTNNPINCVSIRLDISGEESQYFTCGSNMLNGQTLIGRTITRKDVADSLSAMYKSQMSLIGDDYRCRYLQFMYHIVPAISSSVMPSEDSSTYSSLKCDCYLMHSMYKTMPNATWGTASPAQQARWTSTGCDILITNLIQESNTKPTSIATLQMTQDVLGIPTGKQLIYGPLLPVLAGPLLKLVPKLFNIATLAYVAYITQDQWINRIFQREVSIPSVACTQECSYTRLDASRQISLLRRNIGFDPLGPLPVGVVNGADVVALLRDGLLPMLSYTYSYLQTDGEYLLAVAFDVSAYPHLRRDTSDPVREQAERNRVSRIVDEDQLTMVDHIIEVHLHLARNARTGDPISGSYTAASMRHISYTFVNPRTGMTMYVQQADLGQAWRILDCNDGISTYADRFMSSWISDSDCTNVQTLDGVLSITDSNSPFYYELYMIRDLIYWTESAMLNYDAESHDDYVNAGYLVYPDTWEQIPAGRTWRRPPRGFLGN